MPSPSGPIRTILVVDDDPDIRRMAHLSLERIGGFRVLVAKDAEEAIALTKRENPDLVLLDASMPGTDGPATLAALRAVPGAERVPVAFCTAASGQAERLRALGAVAVIAKPFDVVDLPVRVRAIFVQGSREGR